EAAKSRPSGAGETACPVCVSTPSIAGQALVRRHAPTATTVEIFATALRTFCARYTQRLAALGRYGPVAVLI
ncbi:MAG: hypothetical protein V3S45_00540, partial [Kiloniellales bacterium]